MRRLLFSLLLIPFLTLSAQAQQCFKAYIGNREISVICVNTPIRFVDCSGLGGPELIDQDNNNNLNDSFVPNSPSTTFTYTTPGVYKVTQLKSVDPNNPSTFTQTFVVKATPKPHFTATQCGPNQVRVFIKDTNY
ncbi:MAG TPA: hypothetical protein VK927_01990, partial [Adhaeribacter sp.]|nr:hypothetical protein [Adhaeribacter sp.]